MNCNHIRRHLILIIDNEASFDDNIKLHIANCSNCRDYYKKLIKSKQFSSQELIHKSVNINVELNKLKQKIDVTAPAANQNKIYTLLFNNNLKKAIIAAALFSIILIIPINNTSLAKQISHLWSNRITINNENLDLKEGNFSFDFSKEYPEEYKLFKQRDTLIKKALNIKNKEYSYENIDNLLLEYDKKISAITQNNVTITSDVLKYYTNKNILENDMNITPPTVSEDFRFAYAKYYNDIYSKSTRFYYYNIDKTIRENAMKYLYISYSAPNGDNKDQKESASFPVGTKFAPITIGKYKGYIMKSNALYSENINIKPISISIIIFTDQYKISASTVCDSEKDLEQNQEMLLKIIKSNISH